MSRHAKFRTLSRQFFPKIPLTVGFLSKWYLILAALEKGWWVVAGLVLVSSLLAVIYFWKVIESAYFQAAPKGMTKITEVPLSMLIPMWIMIGSNFYFGIDTDFTVSAAMDAAKSLIGDIS